MSRIQPPPTCWGFIESLGRGDIACRRGGAGGGRPHTAVVSVSCPGKELLLSVSEEPRRVLLLQCTTPRRVRSAAHRLLYTARSLLVPRFHGVSVLCTEFVHGIVYDHRMKLDHPLWNTERFSGQGSEWFTVKQQHTSRMLFDGHNERKLKVISPGPDAGAYWLERRQSYRVKMGAPLPPSYNTNSGNGGKKKQRPRRRSPQHASPKPHRSGAITTTAAMASSSMPVEASDRARRRGPSLVRGSSGGGGATNTTATTRPTTTKTATRRKAPANRSRIREETDRERTGQ